MVDNQTPQTPPEGFGLSDPSIAGFMQLLQAALITGTDMLDLMRMLRFEVGDGNQLFITNTSARGVETFCNDLLARAEEASKEKLNGSESGFGAVVDHAEG